MMGWAFRVALQALLAALGIGQGVAATVVSVDVHEGICDASGAVALPEGGFGERFLMVNHEAKVLRIYAVGDPNAVAETDVSRILGLAEAESGDLDLEAATWLEGEALVVGSLSREESGAPAPARRQFFSVAVDSAGGNARIAATAASDRLLAALAALDDDLAAAIGDLGGTDPALAPRKAGIRLEGLSVTPDGTAVFFGFRNPVPNGRALLVKLLNPRAVLFEDADPLLDPPHRIDLGGRGIRSMEYAPAAGAYFIVAGPAGEGTGFDLYRWVEGEEPAPVPGAAQALAGLSGFAPEGLVVDRSGTRLQLFGDDEDCERDTFRSVVLTLE
jgi:hypothetical protein